MSKGKAWWILTDPGWAVLFAAIVVVMGGVFLFSHRPSPMIVVVEEKYDTVAMIGSFPLVVSSAKVIKIGDLNVFDLDFGGGDTFSAHFFGELPPNGAEKSYLLGGDSYTYLHNSKGGDQKMVTGELTVIVFQGNYTFIVPTESGIPVKLFIAF